MINQEIRRTFIDLCEAIGLTGQIPALADRVVASMRRWPEYLRRTILYQLRTTPYAALAVFVHLRAIEFHAAPVLVARAAPYLRPLEEDEIPSIRFDYTAALTHRATDYLGIHMFSDEEAAEIVERVLALPRFITTFPYETNRFALMTALGVWDQPFPPEHPQLDIARPPERLIPHLGADRRLERAVVESGGPGAMDTLRRHRATFVAFLAEAWCNFPEATGMLLSRIGVLQPAPVHRMPLYRVPFGRAVARNTVDSAMSAIRCSETPLHPSAQWSIDGELTAKAVYDAESASLRPIFSVVTDRDAFDLLVALGHLDPAALSVKLHCTARRRRSACV